MMRLEQKWLPWMQTPVILGKPVIGQPWRNVLLLDFQLTTIGCGSLSDGNKKYDDVKIKNFFSFIGKAAAANSC